MEPGAGMVAGRGGGSGLGPRRGRRLKKNMCSVGSTGGKGIGCTPGGHENGRRSCCGMHRRCVSLVQSDGELRGQVVHVSDLGLSHACGSSTHRRSLVCAARTSGCRLSCSTWTRLPTTRPSWPRWRRRRRSTPLLCPQPAPRRPRPRRSGRAAGRRTATARGP